MNFNIFTFLNLSGLYIQALRMYTVNRVPRKGQMRILKKEAEGGLTIADWHGGFVGSSKNGSDKHFHAWFERCPCCRGAFDFGVEVFGYELVAYNDGDSCELEATIEDLQQDMATFPTIS